MSAWENVPYELQSPRWRNAMNGGSAYREKYDPSLNLSYVEKFASAFKRVNSVTDKQVTGNIDGGAPAVDWLKNLTGALLENIGARDDGPPPMVHQAAWGGGGGRSDSLMPMLAIGAVAVGVIYYAMSE